MTSDNVQPSRPVTIVEIIVVLVMTFVISQGFSLGLSFRGFWALVSVALVSIVLAIVALVQSQRLVALALAALAVSIAVTNSPTVRKMFPLQYTIHAEEFSDATVTEVLGHIANCNDECPTWRFHVSTKKLADTHVSMTIRSTASLEEISMS